MTDKNYVALHNHSDYSTLDGFATIDEYIKAAKNNNMIGIGLSDHGTASGLYKFITRAQKEGIIPVPGVEFYLAPENPKGAKVKEPIYYGRGGRASKYDLSNGAYTHLTVFAYNNVGLHNLFKLTSISWQPEHFYFKPRIDTNMLAEHAEGLIVTTGCPNSEINRRFLLGQDEKAYEYASRLKSIFGDNFYVELMDHKMPDDEIERIIGPKLVELSKKLNIPPIITNDSHYAFKEDNEPHERILAVSTRSTMKEPRQCDGGTRFSFSTPEYYIKTYEEMLKTFPGEFGKKALANTVELTLKCKDIKLEYDPHLRPEIDIPEGYTAPTYFQKLIYEGFKKKRGNEPKEIQEESVKRIQKEFEVIHSNDFISYFLVVHDYIDYAHKKGIGVGAGRGCFVPGTKVKANQGAMRNIEDVKVGDKVQTHDTTYQTVENLFIYEVENEDMVRLTLSNGKIIESTSDHMIFHEQEGFMEAKDFSVGDVVLGPKGRRELYDTTCDSCGDSIKIDKQTYDIRSKKGHYKPKGEYWCYDCVKNNIHKIPAVKEGLIKGTLRSKDKDVKEKISKSLKKHWEENHDERIQKWHEYMETPEYDEYRESRRQFNLKKYSDPVELEKLTKQGRSGYKSGYFTSHRQNKKEIYYASSYEQKALNILETSSEVAAFDRYKGKVPYIKPSTGLEHNYLPDFIVEMTDGSTKVVEVKAKWQLSEIDTRAKLEQAEKYFNEQGIKFEIWDEDVLGKLNDDWHNKFEVVKVEHYKYTGKVYDIQVENVHNYNVEGVTVHNSVGGSEIAYVLDISNTDPIRFDLLFERFLSPGRGSLYQIDYVSGESEEIAVSAKKRIYFDNGDDKVVYVHELNPGDVVNYGDNKKVIEDVFVKIPGSAPDIDTDFHTEGREEVVQYCVDKYGEENVANIVTFGTFKAKRAFKAMCTIYNVPFAAANKASSYIPGAQGAEASLEDIMNPTSPRYNEGADFRRATEGEIFEEVVEMASKLDGRISETGVHPCGVIISSEPLAGIIPTQVRQTDGKIITQWEYPELEALGLIKMDMLGLELINTVQQTLENIRLTNESAQDKDEIREIPDMKELLQGNLDDAKTYKMLQEGNTVGIFQLGSPGVRELLKRAKPTEFMDIATITALYRPGPMSMNSHIEWADRKNGTKEVVYIDERLKGTVVEKILEETEGLCVPKGTLIFDSQLGKYTPIETLRPSVSTTPSLNEKTGEIEEKTVNFVVNTGEKEILEITLANNKTLKVSKTHPVRTIHGYKKAEDLTTNDRIVIVKDKLPRKIKSTLSPEEGWVIGAMMGDGSFSPTPYITTTDKDVMEEFEKFINDKFESDVQVNKTTNAKGVTYISFPKSEELRETNYHDKSKLLQWMENLGIDLTGKCNTKKIPEDLLMNNDEVLLNIIAGLWDTDGCVSESSTNFVTTSKHLFENMKTMLNILGINYTEKISKYENNKTQDRISYRIHPSLYDFKTYIQPYLKVERKRNFPIKIANENKVETGLINFHKDIADSFISKLSEEELETINKGKDKNKPIGLKSISTFIKNKYNVDLKYNKTKVINFLIKNKLIQNETLENLEASKYSVKIKKIENVGYEECYDIEVQDNHNFFIDNMVVSNCIFQEQIMQIATQYAGMTPHEADQLRKAMGKKKISIMTEMHPKFVKGAIENGSTKELAEKIWETMEGFGSYGFNKSHSVSYALNIYEAAYLKAHYPAEFMAAVIQQGFGGPNKVKQYIQEAKRMKLRLGPVDINNSQVQMASAGVSKDNEYDIVFGFSGVKQMNDNLAHEIVEERNANGPYKSVADFVKRVSKRTQLTAAPLSNLAKAGAFDCFNVSRKLVSEKAKMLIDSGTKQADKGVSLFDMLGPSSTVSGVTESIEITGEDYEYNEMIKLEADIIGMYVSGHPTSQLGHIARMYKPANLQSILSSGGSKETYNVLGTVTQVASKTNRAGNKSIAVLIDDGNDTSTSYLPRNVVQSIEKYEEIIRIQRAKERGVELKETKRSEKMRELLVDDSIKPMEPVEVNHPYLFKIKTRGWGDNVNISVVDIIKLDTAPDGSLPYEVNVKNENMIKQIKSILTKHKDKNGAYVKVNLIDGTSMILNTRVKLSLDFIIDMENIVGKENIVTEDI